LFNGSGSGVVIEVLTVRMANLWPAWCVSAGSSNIYDLVRIGYGGPIYDGEDISPIGMHSDSSVPASLIVKRGRAFTPLNYINAARTSYSQLNFPVNASVSLPGYGTSSASDFAYAPAAIRKFYATRGNFGGVGVGTGPQHPEVGVNLTSDKSAVPRGIAWNTSQGKGVTGARIRQGQSLLVSQWPQGGAFSAATVNALYIECQFTHVPPPADPVSGGDAATGGRFNRGFN
jgi:hypothetical protein